MLRWECVRIPYCQFRIWANLTSKQTYLKRLLARKTWNQGSQNFRMEKNDKDSDETEKKPKEKFVVRSATDVQRIKLQKLMDNPVCWRKKQLDVFNNYSFQCFQTKEVNIPVPRTKKFDEFGNASTPSFVRNVMGSSAGAGSGEFHVYRHLRRKEYARQKNIQQMSKQVSYCSRILFKSVLHSFTWT